MDEEGSEMKGKRSRIKVWEIGRVKEGVVRGGWEESSRIEEGRKKIRMIEREGRLVR
ncbi:hypothetical protein QA942_27405 [Streptomyces sp. B21-106]|uniref:hypothetical protein n=1 Tax=Streptomyces sp. B21-106 TaxID=3039418 RepID=UPI002FF3FD3A